MIMNVAKAESDGGLSNLRKAAMLLVVLGEGPSAQLLQQLNEDEVQKISREVARITAISAEQAESVLEEFHQLSAAGDYVVRGGIDYARKLLMRAFGPDQAKRLLDRLMKALGADAAQLRRAAEGRPAAAGQVHSQRASPDHRAGALAPELLRRRAALLTSLPADMRADVALRMASLDQISPEIILKIAGVIGQKLKSLGEFSRESYGGVRAVAEMFNRLDSGSSQRNPRRHRAAGRQPGRDHPPPDVRLRGPAADRSTGPQGSARQGRPQGVDGGAEGHQRTVAESHSRAACRSAAPRCCARTWMRWARSRSRKWRAAQQQIIAIVRQLESRGRHEPEGRRRRAVCRLGCMRPRRRRPSNPSSGGRRRLPRRTAAAATARRSRPAAHRELAQSPAAGRCRTVARRPYRQDCARAKPPDAPARWQKVRAGASSDWPAPSTRSAVCAPRLRAEAEADLVQLALAIARRMLRREIDRRSRSAAGPDLKAALGKIEAPGDRTACAFTPDARRGAAPPACARIGTPTRIEVIADPACAQLGGVIFETPRGSLDARRRDAACRRSSAASPTACGGNHDRADLARTLFRGAGRASRLHRWTGHGHRGGRAAGRIATGRRAAIGDFCEIATSPAAASAPR